MDRTSLKSTFFNDACLSTYFPELISEFKKLELANSNYSFKIVDINNRTIRRSFSTKEPVNNDSDTRSILKNIVLFLEKINHDVFTSFELLFQIDDNNIQILKPYFDMTSKVWKFNIINGSY